MKNAIGHLVAGKHLSGDVMEQCIRQMMSGEAEAVQVAAFLTALSIKGETVEEITAAAKVMRELALQVKPVRHEVMVDPVGTGGDGACLFNCSTASAVVASAGGVKIAKHGNIAASSSSGSADVLREAGVKLELKPEQVLKSIDECGFGFMYAPAFHAAMRHVAPVRRAVGIRTIYNLLGPLSNPANVKYQVLGVFSPQWLRAMVEVAKNLGAKRIIAVSADNRLDEFSVTCVNHVCELKADGRIEEYVLDPAQLGLKHDGHDALKVKNAAESLSLIKRIFTTAEPAVGFDMLALNAAAIFMVADRVSTWEDAVLLAKSVMKDGRAAAQLEKIANTSQHLE